MSLTRATLSSTILLATAAAFAATPTHRSPSSTHATLRHSSIAHTAAAHSTHKPEHPISHLAAMDSDRAIQIQTALIKQGYLTGEPTGNWDAESIAAMQKLQGDNGWQTKLTPDSRALIKLGLGPQQDTPTPTP